MVIFIAILLFVLLMALELIWAGHCLKNMYYRASLDTALSEPGATVTQTAHVYNHSRLPVLFAGLMVDYPELVDFEESDGWKKKYIRRSGLQKSTAYSLYLYPRTRSRLQVHFSCRERGVYHFGGHYLEAGDLLGLRSRTRKGMCEQRLVVMPRRCTSPLVMDSLGGLIGDVSVRRFLFEDPVLTIGLREYTGREPMKSIAWLHTARSGKMLVKQFDHTADYHVTVVLNIDGATREQAESCYEIARVALEMLEKKKIAYEFITNADLFTPAGLLSWMAEGLGKRHFESIMWGLGTSRCVCMESFSALVEKCKRRRRMALSYVLITPPLSEKNQAPYQALCRISETPVCLLESTMNKGVDAQCAS